MVFYYFEHTILVCYHEILGSNREFNSSSFFYLFFIIFFYYIFIIILFLLLLLLMHKMLDERGLRVQFTLFLFYRLISIIAYPIILIYYCTYGSMEACSLIVHFNDTFIFINEPHYQNGLKYLYTQLSFIFIKVIYYYFQFKCILMNI